MNIDEFEKITSEIESGELPFTHGLIKRLEKALDMTIVEYYFDPKKRELQIEAVRLENPIKTITAVIE